MDLSNTSTVFFTAFMRIKFASGLPESLSGIVAMYLVNPVADSLSEKLKRHKDVLEKEEKNVKLLVARSRGYSCGGYYEPFGTKSEKEFNVCWKKLLCNGNPRPILCRKYRFKGSCGYGRDCGADNPELARATEKWESVYRTMEHTQKKLDKAQAISCTLPWMKKGVFHTKVEGKSIYDIFCYSLSLPEQEAFYKGAIVATSQKVFTKDCSSSSGGSSYYGTGNSKNCTSSMENFMNSIKDDETMLRELRGAILPHFPRFAQKWFKKLDTVESKSESKRKTFFRVKCQSSDCETALKIENGKTKANPFCKDCRSVNMALCWGSTNVSNLRERKLPK